MKESKTCAYRHFMACEDKLVYIVRNYFQAAQEWGDPHLYLCRRHGLIWNNLHVITGPQAVLIGE